MRRPLAVTVIAAFELSKAGFLLVLMAILYTRSDALLGAGSSLRLLISVATNHIVTSASPLDSRSVGVTLLFPLYAAVCSVFGLGVWFMKRWARRILMWASTIYLARYVQAILIRDWALGQPTVLADHTYTAFAVIDATILLYLFSAKEAFDSAAGEHRKS